MEILRSLLIAALFVASFEISFGTRRPKPVDNT